MPGVQARFILGAVQSGPDGPVSVAAVEGSPETSEGSWPFRCLETHIGAGDGNRTRMTSLEASDTLWPATPAHGCDQEIHHLDSAALPLWVENWVEIAAAWNLCSWCSVVPFCAP
jgi:hypothetical protein